jgi:hypothetical protein
VLKKVAVIAGSATGLMALAPVAYADSSDNDGVNIGNDNNITVAPIQTCSLGLEGVGALVPMLSPENNNCVNAPLVDHPSAG